MACEKDMLAKYMADKKELEEARDSCAEDVNNLREHLKVLTSADPETWPKDYEAQFIIPLDAELHTAEQKLKGLRSKTAGLDFAIKQYSENGA